MVAQITDTESALLQRAKEAEAACVALGQRVEELERLIVRVGEAERRLLTRANSRLRGLLRDALVEVVDVGDMSDDLISRIKTEVLP